MRRNRPVSLGKFASKRWQAITCGAAILGVAHFLFSTALWTWVLWTLAPASIHPITRRYLPLTLAQTESAAMLMLLFAVCLVLAIRGRRSSIAWLAIALLLCATVFIHDIGLCRWTIRSTGPGGCKVTYLTWWWYDGPTAIDGFLLERRRQKSGATSTISNTHSGVPKTS